MCCGYLIACVSSPCSYILTDSSSEQACELSSNLTEDPRSKSMRRMSMSCVTSWYRFIQLAWVGDRQRFCHTIKLSFGLNYAMLSDIESVHVSLQMRVANGLVNSHFLGHTGKDMAVCLNRVKETASGHGCMTWPCDPKLRMTS
ncbi:Uncharacterized protein F383_21404 [Gossypium arboreum]|uniref:Uncharacterized protein n=1 Tax=Gossypium arboreum TaxID=29729 RepID=A0A0B0NPE7_GOSAR|nr:Uncharacterized protein F383_21404 [Gossypium arboreum]